MGRVNTCDQLRFVNLQLHNVHIMCICFTNTEMILNVQIKITCITLNIDFFLFERLEYLSLPVTLDVETWKKHTISMVTIRDGL
jgi:hypothetical protein